MNKKCYRKKIGFSNQIHKELFMLYVGAAIVPALISSAAVFYLIGVAHFAANALIPTLGYLLSTLSLPFFKRLWIQKILLPRDPNGRS